MPEKKERKYKLTRPDHEPAFTVTMEEAVIYARAELQKNMCSSDYFTSEVNESRVTRIQATSETSGKLASLYYDIELLDALEEKVPEQIALELFKEVRHSELETFLWMGQRTYEREWCEILAEIQGEISKHEVWVGYIDGIRFIPVGPFQSYVSQVCIEKFKSLFDDEGKLKGEDVGNI